MAFAATADLIDAALLDHLAGAADGSPSAGLTSHLKGACATTTQGSENRR